MLVWHAGGSAYRGRSHFSWRVDVSQVNSKTKLQQHHSWNILLLHITWWLQTLSWHNNVSTWMWHHKWLQPPNLRQQLWMSHLFTISGWYPGIWHNMIKIHNIRLVLATKKHHTQSSLLPKNPAQEHLAQNLVVNPTTETDSAPVSMLPAERHVLQQQCSVQSVMNMLRITYTTCKHVTHIPGPAQLCHTLLHEWMNETQIWRTQPFKKFSHHAYTCVFWCCLEQQHSNYFRGLHVQKGVSYTGC